MSSEKSASHIQRHHYERVYVNLKASFMKLGYVCPGSVVKRYMPCGKPSCHCAAGPRHYHGPYYEWSRKIRGKTATLRLTRAQALHYQEFTKNHRTLKKILNQMRLVSMRFAKLQLKMLIAASVMK